MSVLLILFMDFLCHPKGLSSLTPRSCFFQTLLQSVCGLSYRGDIRMGLAEDPHKVRRIVLGSRSGLEDMYLPLMTTAMRGKDDDEPAMSSLVTQVGL